MSTLEHFGMNEKGLLPDFQDFVLILFATMQLYMLTFGTSDSLLKFLYQVAKTQILIDFLFHQKSLVSKCPVGMLQRSLDKMIHFTDTRSRNLTGFSWLKIFYHRLSCKLPHIHPKMLETGNLNHSVSLTLGPEISLASVDSNSLSCTPLKTCPHSSKNA